MVENWKNIIEWIRFLHFVAIDLYIAICNLTIMENIVSTWLYPFSLNINHFIYFFPPKYKFNKSFCSHFCFQYNVLLAKRKKNMREKWIKYEILFHFKVLLENIFCCFPNISIAIRWIAARVRDKVNVWEFSYFHSFTMKMYFMLVESRVMYFYLPLVNLIWVFLFHQSTP